MTIQQSPRTSKDYVHLNDVVRLLPLIAEQGNQRIYNLGSGRNTTHAQVASWLGHLGIQVRFASETESGYQFPPLEIDRLASEFAPPLEPFTQANLHPLLSP